MSDDWFAKDPFRLINTPGGRHVRESLDRLAFERRYPLPPPTPPKSAFSFTLWLKRMLHVN